ncbi:rab-GTPase-TBC domain-containing protein [Xylariomycetidae sp. FL2044]|nr:rab-GTPase-TBC domain-containing protein [Xylariomycetidae sp. FL2044]
MDHQSESSNSPLHRSTSQLSSVSARSARGHSVRTKSKSRKLPSQPSSSASSIATSDKSLTSFPSFSPESPRYERPFTPDVPKADASSTRKGSTPKAPASIVDTLTSTDAPSAARSALFDEDSPVATRSVPGALHLADDEHIQRLVALHGATSLVRQLAADLAQRDAQIAGLRRNAGQRERALRKIILECGLSNLELETKLRSVEQELKARDEQKHGSDGGLSDMMSDAMGDSMSYNRGLGLADGLNDTLRANHLGVPKDNSGAKGTVKAWKEYFLGTGTTKKIARAGGKDEDGVKTAVQRPPATERRPPLQDDLFTPPDATSLRSSSRASSVHSGQNPRKSSTSFASMALQLVAGKPSSLRDSDSIRGRSNSAGNAGSLRTSSAASNRAGISRTRAASSQVGPKALMAMRRATPGPLTARHMHSHERWDGLSASPEETSGPRPDNYGPVEMDTIFSPEEQPPTLTHIYNNYHGSEYLTDRFGFIYDQRRKKRQREAAQVARQIKRGSRTEMLSGGRSSISPDLDDNGSSIQSLGDDRPETPTSAEDVVDQGKPRRWQDYLKIATFPTELLSHTPFNSTGAIEVLEGQDQTKSPGLITADERGFFPPASTTSALNNEPTTTPSEESPAATLVHEDNEPVKLLLKQLSDVHDSLQKEKSVRWNEFLRKVRAERRREGAAAAAAAVAAAEARYQRAPVMIPEAKLTDGETIGVADLGVKGKVGRAKWNEFRNLVLGGIPVANRPKIWSECSGALLLRTPGYYEDLVSRPEEGDDPSVISQIDMDINRTLTDNIFFRRGPGVSKLKEVLRAYARRNPEVGYCQGMNLIAANLLLIMPSTEDAFWILVSIIEQILPHGYYDDSLLASRADQQVLRQYVTQILPKLSRHLENLSIDLEALTFQWFLSVFTDCLSAEALFRVWDVVLCINDGSTFLFQVALSLLKLNEQQLLQCDTPAAIYTYISHQMTNHAISIDGLMQASEGLRRVVRREDVDERRSRAIEAENQLVREREERNQDRRTQKAASAPALVTEASASAEPSPAPRPVPDRGESESLASLSALDEAIRTPLPTEEEAGFGLG